MNINNNYKKIKNIEFYNSNLKGDFLKLNYFNIEYNSDIINKNCIVYCYNGFGENIELYAKELKIGYYVIGFKK